MNDKNCGNCKFGANFIEEATAGACRRFPPTLMVQPMPAVDLAGHKRISWEQQASAYPLVAKTGWCGEYEGQLSIAKFDS